MDHPFKIWTTQYAKRDPAIRPMGDIVDGVQQGYYIPSPQILDAVYKWLDMTAEELNELVESQVKEAFCAVWNSRNFQELGIQVTDEAVIGPDGVEIPRDPTFVIQHPHWNTVFIEGFLSLPHLTKVLKAIKTKPNENNPFGLAAKKVKGVMESFPDIMGVVVPDASIIQSLYDRLGVSSFEELFPSQADFDYVFAGEPRVEYNSIDKYYRLKLAGESPIGIVDDATPAIFVDRLPNAYMRRMEQLIANRSGARGDIAAIPKDVLQLITTGYLKGKDLIGLCASNPEVNKICNKDDQALFKRALKSEFGITFQSGLFDYQTARELYMAGHKEAYLVTYEAGQPDFNVYARRVKDPVLPKENQRYIIPSTSVYDPNGNWYVVTFRGDLSLGLIVRTNQNRNVIAVSNETVRKRFNNDAYSRLFISWLSCNMPLGLGAIERDAPGLSELGFDSEAVDISRGRSN